MIRHGPSQTARASMTRAQQQFAKTKKGPGANRGKSKDLLMVVILDRASRRNDFRIIPLARPRIERERDAEGWLVCSPAITAGSSAIVDRRSASSQSSSRSKSGRP